MTEDWTGFDTLSFTTAWYNTEYRTFEFLPVSPTELNPLFSIRETEWSRLRRQEGAADLDSRRVLSGNAEDISVEGPGDADEVEVN